MLYMYFAAPWARPDGHDHAPWRWGRPPGTAAFVALPLVFVAVLCASAVWHVDALSRFRRRRPGSRWPPRGQPARHPPAEAAPPRGSRLGLEMGCHIAMCVAMAFTLVLMSVERRRAAQLRVRSTLKTRSWVPSATCDHEAPRPGPSTV